MAAGNETNRPNTRTNCGSSASEYREYPAPIHLRTHLMCLWTQSIPQAGDPYAHRVMPDGCIDIVFINDEYPAVVGPYIETFIAALQPGTRIVGARFHPGRATGFLGHPASALLNRSVPMDALWKRAACSDFVSPIWEAAGVANRLGALAKALMKRLPRIEPADPAVTRGIEWLAAHPGARLEDLSNWLGIGGRQLRRRFSFAVGYGPKMFQQILRFQDLLNRDADGSARPPLADAALAAGYSDQAHMTREARRFSGISPSELFTRRRCTLGFSGLLRTDPSG
jgi:AraC-like DNA-binding protein